MPTIHVSRFYLLFFYSFHFNKKQNKKINKPKPKHTTLYKFQPHTKGEFCFQLTLCILKTRQKYMKH